MRGSSSLSEKMRECSAHLPLKTCHRAQQLQRRPCSPTRKEIISHLIKYLWVHLLFIYFDQCILFHAAVVLYVTDPQITPLLGIIGPPVPAEISIMQLQSRAKCYRVFFIVSISPLWYSSRLEKLPPLWLNVMEMGNHWKRLLLLCSPALPRHKERNLNRNYESSADNTDYMYGGAGNGRG